MNPDKTPPAEEPAFESNQLEWELFWHRHYKKILSGGVALLVVLVAGIAWYISDTLSTRAAEEALAQAKDIGTLEKVIKKYPKSMAAAAALLLIAADQRTAGKIPDSTATFQKFLEVFPNHPLAGGALFGVAQNFDISGDPKQAIATYQQITAQYPKSYIAPFASYEHAEILLRDFHRDEARRILDNILIQFPKSYVARLASFQLTRLGSNSQAGSTAP